jgi:hypothetical protein
LMPSTERASQSLARKPTSLSVTWTGYARRSSKAPRFQPDEGRPTVARHLQRLPPRTFRCWRNEAYVACTYGRRVRALFQRGLWVLESVFQRCPPHVRLACGHDRNADVAALRIWAISRPSRRAFAAIAAAFWRAYNRLFGARERRRPR